MTHGCCEKMLDIKPLWANILSQKDESLASGSPTDRFLNVFTRRKAEKLVEERDVILKVWRAQVERINAIKDFLIDPFVRTRKKQIAQIIINLDPTAGPTHEQQSLTMFNGHSIASRKALTMQTCCLEEEVDSFACDMKVISVRICR